MKLTDEVTLQTIDLPNDLLWEDEFNWAKVLSSSVYSVTGSLLLDYGTKLEGRPLTFSAIDKEMAWVTRATVQTLLQWSSIPARRFTLLLEYPTDTRQFLVVFAASEDRVQSAPIRGFPGHEDSDWFSIRLKFIEVAI